MSKNCIEWTGGTQGSFGDVRVSKLALDAANQLDELMHGRAFDIQALIKLSDLIKESFALDSDLNATKSYVDSGAVALFLQASDDQPKNIAELVSRARTLANDLENTTAGNEEGTVLRLRDFCLAISTAARAFSEVAYETEQEFA